MTAIRASKIEGCTLPDGNKLIQVDLREPEEIGKDANGYSPYCNITPIELPIVKLMVRRDGDVVVDGLKIADVHLECPETRCPFHLENKKKVENCFTIFPLSVRPNGHSVCFAQYYVAKNLPSEVDLFPTEGGFRCSQHDCPLNRYYGTINHQP